MMGVVTYYLSNDHVARSLFIGFKSLLDDYIGVNQAASVYLILKDIGIALKAVLGYFISDNTSPNDTAVEKLCRLLKIENWLHYRLRCLGYIINLAAQALLFNKDNNIMNFKVDLPAGFKIEAR
jgi:hypothetical protein